MFIIIILSSSLPPLIIICIPCNWLSHSSSSLWGCGCDCGCCCSCRRTVLIDKVVLIPNPLSEQALHMLFVAVCTLLLVHCWWYVPVVVVAVGTLLLLLLLCYYCCCYHYCCCFIFASPLRDRPRYRSVRQHQQNRRTAHHHHHHYSQTAHDCHGNGVRERDNLFAYAVVVDNVDIALRLLIGVVEAGMLLMVGGSVSLSGRSVGQSVGRSAGRTKKGEQLFHPYGWYPFGVELCSLRASKKSRDSKKSSISMGVHGLLSYHIVGVSCEPVETKKNRSK